MHRAPCKQETSYLHGLACLLLLALVACRAQPTSTTRPTESQLEDERKRIARGEDVGASLRAPEIVVDAAGLRVDREVLATLAALPTERHASVGPLFGHLRALREHWTKIHPGRELAGAPTLSVAPGIEAELALDLLGTVAGAGFLSVTLTVGTDVVALDLAAPDVDALDVLTFVQSDQRWYDVTTWAAGDHCSVIMQTTNGVEPTKLPRDFHERATGVNERPLIEEHIMVTMRVGATAQELSTLLTKVRAAFVGRKVRSKLRFAWTPRPCADDGHFGHAR